MKHAFPKKLLALTLVAVLAISSALILTPAAEEGEAAYADGVEQYKQGEIDYAQGVADLEKGEDEYKDGLAEYEDGKAEFDEKIAEAEDKP